MSNVSCNEGHAGIDRFGQTGKLAERFCTERHARPVLILFKTIAVSYNAHACVSLPTDRMIHGAV